MDCGLVATSPKSGAIPPQEHMQIVHRFPMTRIILASASQIRASLLQNAGLQVTAIPARVDEEMIRAALQAEDATPRDIADALAESKARKVVAKTSGLVLGCDQILALGDRIFAKPTDPDDASQQLQALRGKTHQLLSAMVLYDGGQPIWRHVGVARLVMQNLSDGYIDDYLARNWHSVQHSVGCYKLEEEGARMFSQIDGDYFTILGLPLLPLLNFLSLRGLIRI